MKLLPIRLAMAERSSSILPARAIKPRWSKLLKRKVPISLKCKGVDGSPSWIILKNIRKQTNKRGRLEKLQPCQLLQQGRLSGIDQPGGCCKIKPAAFVNFRKGYLFAGPGRPFDIKGITGDRGRIDVACCRPGIDLFAALLPNRRQGKKRARESDAGLFPEFADGGLQSLFVRHKLPFRDRPAPFLLIFPVRPARVNRRKFRSFI